jgi:hypothetical protein
LPSRGTGALKKPSAKPGKMNRGKGNKSTRYAMP